METTLIWILIFAGAAIGLLGLFLFASEKELKVKRRQVEMLAAKLNDFPGGKLDDSVADQEIVRSTEINTRNEELSEQVAALANQLQESQNKIGELQAAELHLTSMESEMAQLRGSYERLLEENSQLRNQLLESEDRLHSSSPPNRESAARYSQMEAEVAELRDELEKSMMQVRELENQQHVAKLESDQNTLLEQQSLQARINELEDELAAEREKLADFNVAQSQLSEMERRYVAIDQENTQLHEEITRCREQLAESDEHHRRLMLVRQQLDQLDVKHAVLAQQHGQIQEDLAALRGFVSAAPETPLQLECSEDPFRNAGNPFLLHATESIAASSSANRGETVSHRGKDPNETTEGSRSESTAPAHIQRQNDTSHASHTSAQTNGSHGYKIFVGMIPVMLIAGTVVAGLLRKNSIEPDVPVLATSTAEHVTAGLAEPKADRETTLARAAQNPVNEAPAAAIEKRQEAQVLASTSYSGEKQVTTVAVSSAEANPRPREPAGTKVNAMPSKSTEDIGNPSPRVWGGYEIIRPAQVYSEPSENSQLITKLDSGTQVNVVSARDGWLEIRLRNGRPPGFVKSDSAVRTKQ